METTAKRIKSVNAACVGLLAVVAFLAASAGYCEAIPGCMSSQLTSLQSCLPAVEGDSPPKPTEACCTAIRGTDTVCLCNIVMAYSNSMGVNYESAMQLPKLCKHTVPGGFTCADEQASYGPISVVHNYDTLDTNNSGSSIDVCNPNLSIVN